MSNGKATRRLLAGRRSGQGLVEYVLIAGFAAIGLVLALTVFRNQIGATMDNTNAGLQSAPTAGYTPGTMSATGGTVGGGTGGSNNGRGGGTGGGQGSGRGGGRGNGN